MIQLKKNIDLNLLVCLDALLTEGSVTRAAERLDMSQPGMSHALSRLRELTGDALFVRSGNEFRQTDRAKDLANKVRSGLAALEGIFSEEGPFEPSSTAGRLTVAAADSVSVMLMPRLADALAQKAPMVTLQVRLPDAERMGEWLAEGECDLAIGYLPDLGPDLHCGDLFGNTLSCISGPKHARAGLSLDLDQYLESSHVVFSSPFSLRSTMETTIDQTLTALGKKRAPAVQISSMLLIPYVVADSPHIAALPAWLARHYASSLPLEVRPLPLKLPPINCRMAWHDRTHRTGLHRWTRALLRSLTQELARSKGAVSVASSMEGVTFARP